MDVEDFYRFCDDFDVAVCVLSRDRADILKKYTDRIASGYTLFYCGDGYDEHEYHCKDMVKVDRGLEGRPAVANMVLRTMKQRTLFLLPDDIRQVVWLGEDKLQHIDRSGFLVLLTNLTINMRDAGAGICGISEVDIRKTSPLAPFHMRAMTTGLVGIDGRGIYFDERNKIKADYDYVLQHLKRDRFVWKDMRYFLFQDRNNLPGGALPFRTVEREEAEVQNLRDWWGDDMIRWENVKGTKSLSIRVR